MISICLSDVNLIVWPCSNSRKYTRVAMQLLYAIEIHHRMFAIKNRICIIYSSFKVRPPFQKKNNKKTLHYTGRYATNLVSIFGVLNTE